jgi:hypothetical protein
LIEARSVDRIVSSPVSRTRVRVERLLIAVFLAVITLPLLARALPLDTAFALTENRKPAPFPAISLKGWVLVTFPRRFEKYWNDSFGFRRLLIRWHSFGKIALGVSPSPKALIGKSGYLFYTHERSLEYFRGVTPFTPAELERWQQELERREAWLRARGIRFLVLVAPNKETIYPEFMPDVYRRTRPDSRLDQLLEHLRRRRSPVEVLDLREPLRLAKARERIYHRTDTHWNDAGAYIAYGEILRRLHPWFPEVSAEPRPAERAVRVKSGGDLARLLALEDRFPEESIDMAPRQPRRARPVAFAAPAGVSNPEDFSAFECDGCGGPRVIMYQDSFNTNLAPFLSEHFSRIVYGANSRLLPELFERERPALFLHELVERVLMCPGLQSC